MSDAVIFLFSLFSLLLKSKNHTEKHYYNHLKTDSTVTYSRLVQITHLHYLLQVTYTANTITC